jgi:pimeloyl-ACP methyl ester carboxylesterase
MLKVRTYGTAGSLVIVVHGGPGAAGSMAPVARGLADSFRVLEPFQRSSGEQPLTVSGHVEDLYEVARSAPAGAIPALVGHSWGAMLALACAAAHPDAVGPIVLIGCGTFDRRARAQLRANLDERMDDATRLRMEHLAQEFPDPNERLAAMGELTLPLYCYDSAAIGSETQWDPQGRSHQAWDDMVGLQDQGVYPAAFGSIKAPILMIHGAADPHPGPMIRDGLTAFIPQLEYRELQRCGHYPWNERFASAEFFSVLRGWLSGHTTPQQGSRANE